MITFNDIDVPLILTAASAMALITQWLFGMKIVISVGCRRQIMQRLERLHGASAGGMMPGVRVTSPETLRILEEEAGFCRFEVERLLNPCLRNKGADCNVVSGCFVTARKFGIVDGVDYQVC